MPYSRTCRPYRHVGRHAAQLAIQPCSHAAVQPISPHGMLQHMGSMSRHSAFAIPGWTVQQHHSIEVDNVRVDILVGEEDRLSEYPTHDATHPTADDRSTSTRARRTELAYCSSCILIFASISRLQNRRINTHFTQLNKCSECWISDGAINHGGTVTDRAPMLKRASNSCHEPTRTHLSHKPWRSLAGSSWIWYAATSSPSAKSSTGPWR